MMTLIQTAELNGADPYYYLKYLMDELPRHLYQDPSTFVKDMVPWSEKYREYEISERQKTLDSVKPPGGIPKPDIKKRPSALEKMKTRKKELDQKERTERSRGYRVIERDRDESSL